MSTSSNSRLVAAGTSNRGGKTDTPECPDHAQFPLKRLADALAEMAEHPQLSLIDLDMIDENRRHRRRKVLYTAEDKTHARRLIREAVKRGTIIKPAKCEHCGKQVASDLLHGHHSDYGKPYAVDWLCIPCHSQVHSEVEVQVRRPLRVVRV